MNDDSSTHSDALSAALSAEKRETAAMILDQGIVMVHLDPRRDGVQVPARFAAHSTLRLNFAYGFQLPNFALDEDGIGAVLNFNGERASCWIPWTAVFAITAPEYEEVSGFWPQSAPREMLRMLDEAAEGAPKSGAPTVRRPVRRRPTAPAPRRPHLRAVAPAASATEPAVAAPNPTEPEGAEGDDSRATAAADKAPRPRPRLRIVE